MAMEHIVARARKLAGEQPFEHAEVIQWLREGTDEQRIIAAQFLNRIGTRGTGTR
jgi:hypothetical protein